MQEQSTPHFTLLNTTYEETVAKLAEGQEITSEHIYVAAVSTADAYSEVLSAEPDTVDKFKGLEATWDFLIDKKLEIEQAA